MNRTAIILLTGLLHALPSAAQHTAFRYVIGEVHNIYDAPKFNNYCMGIGLDRALSDHLVIGLDVTYDLANAFKDMGSEVYLTSAQYRAEYGVKPTLLSLNYHTEYALGNDDGTHAYIGTFIGLRMIKQNWVLSYVEDLSGNYSGYDQGPFLSAFKLSKVLVPIGIRLGLRGTTEGGFGDLYTALGYQIGGGSSLGKQATLPAKGEFLNTSSLAVTFGLAYGFGW